MKIRQNSSEVKPPGSQGESEGTGTPLPRSFYNRDPVEVARDLVGKRIVRAIRDAVLVGRIVETEAYRSSEDAASHARMGRTTRNGPMFGPAGHSYVYFIYGMHWMFNIAAHPADAAGAVLVRALEPESRIDVMRELRGQTEDRILTNGPAKLAQALGIDGTLNDLDLVTSQQLTVIGGPLRDGEQIATGPRVRVPGGELARRRPWRFWVADSPWVSS